MGVSVILQQYKHLHRVHSDPPVCLHRYDTDSSNFIDLMELKLMMEKLGEPQTHIGLKGMIKEVDEDNDGQISFREVSCSTVEVPVTCSV